MCSKGCAKFILVVLNFVFFILGGVALGLGIFVLVDKSKLTYLLRLAGASEITEALNVPSLLENSAYALIAGGGFIFLISFLGCCGALKEVKIFLMLYAILVSLILLLEIAAVVVVYFFSAQIEATFLGHLNKTITDKYEGMTFVNGSIKSESTEPFSIAWDFAHITLDCCGLSNYTDYENYATKWNNVYSFGVYNVTAKVPVSCCKFADKSKFPTKLGELQFQNITECLRNANPKFTNTEACYDKVKDIAMSYSWILIGVGIGIAVFELLGIISACMLRSQLSKDD